ncbi:MAG: acetamidase/formamidase family protein [Dehalococcoidia bacterium]|nr:MAG: acetamidase/formamidase family protein [Dehalococcoidia bacterium]
MEYQYTYNRNAEPFAVIKPGGTVTFQTEDAFRGLIKKNEDGTEENINGILELSCPVTGPIVVEGAEPGNWVEISIDNIECGSYGVSVLGDHFCTIGEIFENYTTLVVPIKDGIIHLNEKIKFPAKPMIGTIGTTPKLEMPLSCLEGIFGGNMDCPSVTIGSKLYLPVFIDGAYIYAGDCHAIQGDGEIINPFEMQAKVTLTVDVLKEKSSVGKWPRLKTKNTIETVASDRTFYFAAKIAMVEMINWLVEDYGFEFNEAAFFCGQVVDARCCQIGGNAYHTARCVLDIEYLKDITS